MIQQIVWLGWLKREPSHYLYGIYSTQEKAIAAMREDGSYVTKAFVE